VGEVSDPTASFATPRIAAGALFVDGDRVLLVRKTYGNGWTSPVATPRSASHRPQPASGS
jgi:hypothetical protein